MGDETFERFPDASDSYKSQICVAGGISFGPAGMIVHPDTGSACALLPNKTKPNANSNHCAFLLMYFPFICLEFSKFFRKVSGNELRDGRQIEQAVLKEAGLGIQDRELY